MSHARTLRVFVAVVLVSVSFAQAGEAISRPAPPPATEVLKDGRVVFRIRAPKASEVLLRGDWLAAPEKLTRDAAGLWSVTLGPLPAELYTYFFDVDGVKTIDPRNPAIKPGLAGSDNLLFV